MSTERQPPDAVLAFSNLTGGLADIDDDPDAPDGNWMVATGNNVTTDVRTSFGSPSGNPTVGADLQEFKAWVRQYDEAQTGTPECRLELWEDGILVRAGSDTPVPDGGLLLSFTWNGNELGTPDGSLVECKIVGTKSGGAPGARNTVDMGAVEWNVTYTAGADVLLEGQSDGSSTATAALAREVPLAVAADGVATVEGTLSTAGGEDRLLEGAAAGQSTVTGALVLAVVLSGLAEGECTVTGTLALEGEPAGKARGRYGLLGGPFMYADAS